MKEMYGETDLMPIFKSGLEVKAWKILKKHIPRVKYEPDAIPYKQPAKERKYTPDFKVANGVYIEAKGKLDLATRQKMVWFKDMHPRITIIFLFMNPDNKITKRSKTTYGMWATKEGFLWLDFRKDWIKQYMEMIK